MTKIVIASILLIFVSGCATSSVKYSESDPVPENRVYSIYEKYSKADATSAKLTIVRDSGIIGAAGSMALFINGDLVARLRREESIYLYISPGKNDIAVGPGGLFDSTTGVGMLSARKGALSDGVIEHTFMAERGKEYTFQVGIKMGMWSSGLVIQRTSQVE